MRRYGLLRRTLAVGGIKHEEIARVTCSRLNPDLV